MWGYLYVTWFQRIFDVSAAYRSFATTVSQLKICDFSGETFKGFEVL
jgi:archaellum component FlaF (FlaF/FlaG flagellin family)